MMREKTKIDVDLCVVQGILKDNIIPKGTEGVIVSEDYETGGLFLKFDKPFRFMDATGEIQFFRQLRYNPKDLEVIKNG